MHIFLIIALTTTVMSTQAAEKLQFVFKPAPQITILSDKTDSAGTRYITAQLKEGDYTETIQAEQSLQTGCRYVQKNCLNTNEIKKVGRKAGKIVRALTQYIQEERDSNLCKFLNSATELSTLSPKSRQQFEQFGNIAQKLSDLD